jgi:hypothetical protein
MEMPVFWDIVPPMSISTRLPIPSYKNSFFQTRHCENLKVTIIEIDTKHNSMRGSDGVDWINLAHDRSLGRALLNTAVNFQVP